MDASDAGRARLNVSLTPWKARHTLVSRKTDKIEIRYITQ